MHYWGESSRSGFRRGLEHTTDLRLLNTTSHMVSHMVKTHPELDLMEEDNRVASNFFKMEFISKFSTAMDRQLSEALSIAREEGLDSPNIMNGCDEYIRCVLPELMTTNEIRLKEKAKRAREQEAQDI